MPSRLYTLERAPDLPDDMLSMMLAAERDVLFSIAKNYCVGAGDIIDAGIFMGASTHCFVRGLAQNPRGTCRIHAYERAIVGKALAALRPDLGHPRDSYGDPLRAILSRIGGNVELHIGNILEVDYSGAIEVLFLDIMKQRDTFRKCNALFMGNLIPGHSLVIQQDHYWPLNWYIATYMQLLEEYFTIVDRAETSCIFLNTKALPADVVNHDPLDGLSPAHIVALLDRARDTGTTPFQVMMMELCVVAYGMQSGNPAITKSRLAEFEAKFDPAVRQTSPRVVALYRKLRVLYAQGSDPTALSRAPRHGLGDTATGPREIGVSPERKPLAPSPT
jgi:hypothetical protein